jgi:hypothetical protein
VGGAWGYKRGAGLPMVRFDEPVILVDAPRDLGENISRVLVAEFVRLIDRSTVWVIS